MIVTVVTVAIETEVISGKYCKKVILFEEYEITY